MLPGVEDVVIDCAAGTVEVRFTAGATSEKEIAAALEEIGYPPA
jgi:copper chaperone CopZ